MIKKRELLNQIERLEEKLALQDAAMSAQMEGLAHVNLALEALQEKAVHLAEKTAELARIIEEDFMPDDSLYRQAKAAQDSFLASVNNILTFTGNKPEGRDDV